VPSAARELQLVDPNGRVRDVFVRDDTILALQEQARAGVDIIWNTHWLDAPELLRELTVQLGLDGVVRSPDDYQGTVVNSDLWSDLRMRSIVERARLLPQGDDLVASSIDFDLSSNLIAEGIRRRSGNPAPLLGSIPTNRTSGLDSAALRAWTPLREHVGTWHRRSAP
jgi:hypothetical protein